MLMQEEKMQQLVLNWNSRSSQLLAPVVSGILELFCIIHLHDIINFVYHGSKVVYLEIQY